MTWKHGRQTPDNNLMRFVARRFSPPALMLDIGSGEGANARELAKRGHDVVTLDSDLNSDATMHVDIRNINMWLAFDLIYDVNTLCHVPDPPFGKIKSWLKPNGAFFSIFPASDAPDWIEDGKDFTRRVDFEEALQMLKPHFADIQIWNHIAPDFLDDYLSSWIVEAK